MCHRGPCSRGGDALRFSGWGQGFRQLAAPGRRFCAVCEGLRCATCRYRPLAHRKGPSIGFWWVPMRGCLAEWRRGRRRSRVKPAMRRGGTAAAPSGAGAARSRRRRSKAAGEVGERVRARAQNMRGDLTGWSNLLSAVRTRLEPAQARAFRAIHVTPRRQGGCPLGGRVSLVRDGRKTRNGVQVQGPKLRFCGADEARKST